MLDPQDPEFRNCTAAGKRMLSLALGQLERHRHTDSEPVQEALVCFITCVADLLSSHSYFLSEETQSSLARIYNLNLWEQRSYPIDRALFELARTTIPTAAAVDLFFHIIENGRNDIEEARARGVKTSTEREKLLEECVAELQAWSTFTSGAEAQDFEVRDQAEAVLEKWTLHPTLSTFAKEIRHKWTREDVGEE